MGKKRHSLLLLWRWHSYGPLCQRRRRQPSPDCADLAELILPQGETYESLLPSLFDSRRAFNHRLYIENGQIGEEKDLKDKEFKAEIEAARTIAIWRIKNGNAIRSIE